MDYKRMSHNPKQRALVNRVAVFIEKDNPSLLRF